MWLWAIMPGHLGHWLLSSGIWETVLAMEILWGAFLYETWFSQVVTNSCKSFEQNRRPLHFWKILYKILSMQELICVYMWSWLRLSVHTLQTGCFTHTYIHGPQGPVLHFTVIRAHLAPTHMSATFMSRSNDKKAPMKFYYIPWECHSFYWKPLPWNG